MPDRLPRLLSDELAVNDEVRAFARVAFPHQDDPLVELADSFRAMAKRVESLSEVSLAAASEIVREYMVLTEIERGNADVHAHGLPDVLQRECAGLLDSYAEPNRLLLALIDDDLVGCIGVKLRDGDAEISRLYVRDAFRGQGVASGLMAAAEDYARSRGCSRIVLDVLPSRASVIGWYRRIGFRDTAPFEELPMPMVYLEKSLGDT